MSLPNADSSLKGMGIHQNKFGLNSLQKALNLLDVFHFSHAFIALKTYLEKRNGRNWKSASFKPVVLTTFQTSFNNLGFDEMKTSLSKILRKSKET